MTVRGYSLNEADYRNSDYSSDKWTEFGLNNDLRMNLARTIIQDNLYLNVDDSGYLTPAQGESVTLEAFRVWQAVNNTISNNFIEPDFHYEVIGDSVAIEERARRAAARSM